MLITLHLAAGGNETLRAIRTEHAMLEIEGFSVAQRLRDDHLDPFAIDGMNAL